MAGGQDHYVLTTEAGIHGLHELSAKDKARVEEANVLLAHTISLIKTAYNKGIPILMENPKSSRIWLMPNMIQLLGGTDHEIVHVDYCQYGEATWRKPTIFVTWNLPGLKLNKCSNFQRCSRTGKPHTSLIGKKNCTFLTKLAEPYPSEMCEQIATYVLQRHVTSTDTLGRTVVSSAATQVYDDIQDSCA